MNGHGPADRPPRTLDPIEIRVVGALLEKEQTTPDAYPLTLNSLVSACNQKSNRDPIMSLEEIEVSRALERLLEDVLVWRSEGARSERWKVNVNRRWRLGGAAKAVMTLLLLRGPQTVGELRGRSGRMHEFESPTDVEAVLRDLAAGPDPLIVELPRQPGQKENRWMHLVGGPVDLDAAPELSAQDGPGEATAPPASSPARAQRTARGTSAAFPPTPDSLDRRLERVERRLDRLERELGLEPLGDPTAVDGSDDPGEGGDDGE